MGYSLFYFAQPFAAGGGPLLLKQFECAMDAERGGKQIYGGPIEGVLIYQQWIDRDTGQALEIEVLDELGKIPSDALVADLSRTSSLAEGFAYFRAGLHPCKAS